MAPDQSRLPQTATVSAVSQVVAAFAFSGQSGDVAAEFPELLVSKLGVIVVQLFELCDGHFNGKQIGRIKQQVAD